MKDSLQWLRESKCIKCNSRNPVIGLTHDIHMPKFALCIECSIKYHEKCTSSDVYFVIFKEFNHEVKPC